MTIFFVPIEPIETRYTCEWYTSIPNAITQAGGVCHTIDGNTVNNNTTNGAFLDFATTNMYKSEQFLELCRLFNNGTIKDGDKILYADAWNPTIIQMRYMIGLAQRNIELHGIWHAGAYDPYDFLGRAFPRNTNKGMCMASTEMAMFECLDYSYFATQFHIDLFKQNVLNNCEPVERNKIVLSGQPHNEMVDKLLTQEIHIKEDLILFPHRIAPEKQLDIFKDLEKELGHKYQFVVCQESKLSKAEYHNLLRKSKMIFSASLQETLGISPMEGLLVNSIPAVPDRLSYAEMYTNTFKYPSEWSLTFDNYVKHKAELIKYIENLMDNYPFYLNAIATQRNLMLSKYLNADVMITQLVKGIDHV